MAAFSDRKRKRRGVHVWSLFSAENEQNETPHLPSDRKKRAFREFGKLAVLSTFSARKGAVTSNGDSGKTFSRMQNLVVLEGFFGRTTKIIRLPEAYVPYYYIFERTPCSWLQPQHGFVRKASQPQSKEASHNMHCYNDPNIVKSVMDD